MTSGCQISVGSLDVGGGGAAAGIGGSEQSGEADEDDRAEERSDDFMSAVGGDRDGPLEGTGGETSTGGQTGTGGSGNDDAGSGGSSSGPEIVNWTEQVAVNVALDGSVRLTTDDSYGAHAYSTQSIPGDGSGYFQFETYRMAGFVGLAASPVGGGFANIDFALQLWSDNRVYVVENGAQRGLKTSWDTGDIMTIEIDDGAVRYLKNGSPFYTSSEAARPDADYHADFAGGGADKGFNSPEIFVEP